MELIDSVIFIQGLVWTTLLLTGPINKERIIAGLFITAISVMALLDYFLDYTFLGPLSLLDYFMLILFLTTHLLLIIFIQQITYFRQKRWIWIISAFFLVIAGMLLLLKYRVFLPGTDWYVPVLIGCVLVIPLAAIIVSFVIIVSYHRQMNFANGSMNNYKTVVLLNLIAGFFTSWILFFYSIWPFRELEYEMSQPFWKMPIAIMIFMLGFQEIKNKEIRRKSEIRSYKKVNANTGSELRKVMEDEKMYTDTELTLEKIADRMHIPPSELTLILNRELGTSFYKLVNGYRVREVKKKLEKEDYRYYTILAIAFECGFNSKSTFNRVFKEFTGFTPSAYRHSLIHQIPR